MIGERKPVPGGQRRAVAFTDQPFRLRLQGVTLPRRQQMQLCRTNGSGFPLTALRCLVLDLFLTWIGGKALLSSDSTSVSLTF